MRCASLSAFLLLASLVARSQTPGSPAGPTPASPPKAADAASAAAAQSSPPRVPPAPAHTQPHFIVILDAAHGGTDDGARLGGPLLEKNLVLTLSVRLRSMLNAHGIAVVTTRESDSSLAAVNRAEIADHAQAAACISLHATTSGTGVHLFTSSLTQLPMTRFLPWDTAQGAYAGQSLRLSSEINSAMTRAAIPVTLGSTAMEPLDSFTCPAVEIEVAPLKHSGSVTPLSDPDYQNQLVSTVAAALEDWQLHWKEQP